MNTTDILKTALLMEMKGKAFYEKIAQHSTDPDVANIFLLMAKEEQTHIDFLSKHYVSFHSTSAFAELKLIEKDDNMFAAAILNKKAVQKISSVGYEAAAISAAIDMENKAVEFYSLHAKETNNPAEKELFQWLADWEKGHHHILNELNTELQEKIWNDNHFWPF
ncbi:MAG: ferritin family protein [Bacteroidota bacterium]